jgi:hypothetical protein
MVNTLGCGVEIQDNKILAVINGAVNDQGVIKMVYYFSEFQFYIAQGPPETILRLKEPDIPHAGFIGIFQFGLYIFFEFFLPAFFLYLFYEFPGRRFERIRAEGLPM